MLKNKLDLNNEVSGFIYMILAAFFWSIIGCLGRFTIDAGLSQVEIAFWRSLFAASVFSLHILFYRQYRGVKISHFLLMLLFGIFGIGVFFTSLQYSIALSGGAMAVILEYTAPIWVALFAYFFFQEKMTKRKIIAMLLALLGTILLCLSGSSMQKEISAVGIFCGLLSGFCFACHYPFFKYWQKFYHISTIYGAMFIGGAIALAFISPIEPAKISPSSWLALLTLGIVCCYLAYFCYGRGLTMLGMVKASIICYLEPVLSAILLYIFWQENFSALGWLASGLVLASVLYLSLERSNAK